MELHQLKLTFDSECVHAPESGDDCRDDAEGQPLQNVPAKSGRHPECSQRVLLQHWRFGRQQQPTGEAGGSV